MELGNYPADRNDEVSLARSLSMPKNGDKINFSD
jgi:hypothetical protein